MVVSVNEMLPLHRFEVVVTSVEDVNDSASLSFSYDLIGKLFEDAIVTLCVGIRKSALGSVLTKSKVIGFGCMSLSCQDNITKTFTVGKLTEHQDCKLVPAGKLLDITIPIVFVCKSEEYILIDEVLKLREHVFSFMHMPFYISLAKIISNRRATKISVTT